MQKTWLCPDREPPMSAGQRGPHWFCGPDPMGGPHARLKASAKHMHPCQWDTDVFGLCSSGVMLSLWRGTAPSERGHRRMHCDCAGHARCMDRAGWVETLSARRTAAGTLPPAPRPNSHAALSVVPKQHW